MMLQGLKPGPNIDIWEKWLNGSLNCSLRAFNMATSGDIKRPEALQTPSAPLCYRGAYLRWPSGLPPGKPTFICIVCPIMSGLSSKLVIIASIICRTLHLNEASYMLLCLNESKASKDRRRCFHLFREELLHTSSSVCTVRNRCHLLCYGFISETCQQMKNIRNIYVPANPKAQTIIYWIIHAYNWKSIIHFSTQILLKQSYITD